MTEIRPLNEELKAIAKNELNEVESRIVEDISTLRTWIQKQPHLRARTDDQFLVTFLRGCKYSMEKAKSKIDYYYTIKALIPEMFVNLQMTEEFVEFARLGCFLVLPKPLGGIGGPRIYLTNFTNLDPNKNSLKQYFRYHTIVHEFEINMDDTGIINGFVEIVDYSKYNPAFIKEFNPIFLKKLLVFLDKAVPIRIKGLHIVNPSKEGTVFLNIVRTFLNEKQKQRLFIHKSLEDLYKVIPKENLPIEYGGTNGSISEITADMEKKLLDFNNYFIEETQYGVDEKLRIGKKVNSETLFGIDGSFRKLNFYLNMTEIRPLNEELKAIAKNELNEVESRIVEDISTLRTWIQKQPHLRARTDDQFLVTFLRGCKYSMEKAKSKIDYYYTIGSLLPELCTNLQVNEKIIQFGRAGCFVVLPKPLGGMGGHRIHLTIYKNLDPNKHHLVDMLQYQTLINMFEINMDDNCAISGVTEIVDLSKLNKAILKEFDPIYSKKLITFYNKAQPLRMKGFHFLNCPKEGAAFLNIARSFLNEKLKQRFFIHKSLEDLYKVIPKENLPIEYGGTNGSIPEIQADMEKKLLDFNNYFMEETKYGVDEELRIGKKINSETLFGIDGSFRKLNID
ncbi:uncharacterized protein LOC119674344 [Teleopsis dalmanni]|uniref:uncharacterized protein LOC119674344 n=2 Tax=Teleopsis dalmanni TaxID=139649 RepID=UPI0018CEFFB1|nr:uncharacterized protein LOC119674344 [Teleopsis dalmanni]